MSNHINESHIYFDTKNLLSKMGWVVIAGEPAGGSDEIPRIEIRDPNYKLKGSKGSYKVDLISTKNDCILLTEVKIRFDRKDIEKLNEIVDSKRDLLQRALSERLGINIREKKIIKSIALNSCSNEDIPKDFVCFKIGQNAEIINENLLSKN